MCGPDEGASVGDSRHPVEGEVAAAIKCAYESFDLSMLPRLDDRLWPEMARAALDSVCVSRETETSEKAERFAVENTEHDRAVWEKIDALRAAGGTPPEPSEEAIIAAYAAFNSPAPGMRANTTRANAEHQMVAAVRAAYKTDFGDQGRTG